MKKITGFLLKYLVLSFFWFALSSLDFINFQLASTEGQGMIWRAVMALLDSLALVLILSRSCWRGRRLALALFLAIFGMKTILTAVEATYLPTLVPLVGPLLVNGLISSALYVILAVLIWGQNAEEETGIGENGQKTLWNYRWVQWLWRVPVLALVWMVLFVVFGALVFINLATALDPAALANYSNLDMPAWVLPFQGLRAILWLILVFPMIQQLRGTKWQIALIVGFTFAVWMGSNLLMAVDLPVGLRFAHLLEVGGESFAFGVIMVLLFARKNRKDVLNPIPENDG